VRYSEIHQIQLDTARYVRIQLDTVGYSQVNRPKIAVDRITKVRVSLYTILSLPMLYGVWHIKGGSGGGHTLRKSRAIVLQ